MSQHCKVWKVEIVDSILFFNRFHSFPAKCWAFFKRQKFPWEFSSTLMRLDSTGIVKNHSCEFEKYKNCILFHYRNVCWMAVKNMLTSLALLIPNVCDNVLQTRPHITHRTCLNKCRGSEIKIISCMLSEHSAMKL